MNQQKAAKQDSTRLAMLMLVWTAYGVFFASQSFFRSVYSGRPAIWYAHLIPWLICGYTWAALTPLVLALTRRFSFEHERRLISAAVHIPLALVFSFLQIGFYVFVFQIVLGTGLSGFAAMYQRLLPEEFHAGVLVYLSIVAVDLARRYFFTRPIVDAPRPGEHAVSEPPPAIQKSEYISRFPVKAGGRIVLVDVARIEWINSEGNYVKLHTAGKRYLIRDTMNAIEKKLDPAVFVRIRRSAIVRSDLLSELKPTLSGEFEVVLKGGTRLTASRRYRKNIEPFLKF